MLLFYETSAICVFLSNCRSSSWAHFKLACTQCPTINFIYWSRVTYSTQRAENRNSRATERGGDQIPGGLTAGRGGAEGLNGTSSSDRVLKDKDSRNVDSHGWLKVTRQGVEKKSSLTDVVVFPHVAHRHVAHQQHSNSANAALLHIDVLVVISVMACNAKGQKKCKYMDNRLAMLSVVCELPGPTQCHHCHWPGPTIILCLNW